MSNIVIDASTLIAVVTNEPGKDKLIRLTQNVDLIAPHAIHWEIGNAFSAMLKRKRITVEQAIAAIQAYQMIPVRLVDVELDETLRVANSLNIYAYDAYLIRCSVKYRAPLLSLDQGLIHAARTMNIQIVEE